MKDRDGQTNTQADKQKRRQRETGRERKMQRQRYIQGHKGVQ